MTAMRAGVSSDQAVLDGLLEAEGMGAGVDPSEFVVVESDGRIVGIARAEVIDGDAWIRPIAVTAPGRGRGIGSTLVRELAARHGTLRVVARGASAGFYAALGFVEMGWETTAEGLRAECEQCPDLDACHPVPMVRW
jgi:N-acetylglutamate synthase-like GNAT family acetyltransferase